MSFSHLEGDDHSIRPGAPQQLPSWRDDLLDIEVPNIRNTTLEEIERVMPFVLAAGILSAAFTFAAVEPRQNDHAGRQEHPRLEARNP